MSRLIDVDVLKADYHMADDCKDCETNVRDCEYDHVYTKMDFCSWLDDAPTVDAVPVAHGWWKAVTDDGDEYKRICSCCGEEAPFDESEDVYLLYPHCPWCGASLDIKGGNGNG